MLYRFSEKEIEMLLGLALHNAVECASEYDGGRAGPQFDLDREDFLTACRIVSELHAPSPSQAPLGAYMEPNPPANHMRLEMDDDMREAVLAEGIDPARELNELDTRALDPKCVHGRKRSEPCDECSATDGAYAHKIGAVEQAALDAALDERQRVLGEASGLQVDTPLPPSVDLERVPVRSVMHRDSCPVSHERFQPLIGGPSQCTCDFGRRLAEELGIPHG